MKEKVRKLMIKYGNNPERVEEMINANFDYAVRKYKTASKIAECLIYID